MNEVNNDKKASAIKTLAIIGFITAIVGGVWLAVQAVRYFPAAFSNLASMAETVYSKDTKFVISIEKNIVNTGEPFTISWTKMRKTGTYDFSYTCTDGISAEMRAPAGLSMPIACETPIELTADVTETDLIFSSEKKRFTDIPFTIRYTPAINMEAVEEKGGLVTVVNVSLAEERIDTEGEVAGAETETQPEPVTEEEPEEVPVTAPTPPTPKPVMVEKPVVTTFVPVSNPNGYTDLAATFIAVGTFNESTRVFTPRTTLDNDLRGAVRFEVKNIGTKTSGTWTYRVTLPSTDNDTYESSVQAPLKPNERAVITIAFGDVNQKTGTDTLHVEVRGGNDTISSNNSFTKSVTVVN